MGEEVIEGCPGLGGTSAMKGIGAAVCAPDVEVTAGMGFEKNDCV